VPALVHAGEAFARFMAEVYARIQLLIAKG
jgi:hypothetical protein